MHAGVGQPENERGEEYDERFEHKPHGPVEVQAYCGFYPDNGMWGGSCATVHTREFFFAWGHECLQVYPLHEGLRFSTGKVQFSYRSNPLPALIRMALSFPAYGKDKSKNSMDQNPNGDMPAADPAAMPVDPTAVPAGETQTEGEMPAAA